MFQWPLYPNRLMTPTPNNVVMSPLEAGADGIALADVLETVWLPSLEKFKPDLIMVSAGFDAHTE